MDFQRIKYNNNKHYRIKCMDLKKKSYGIYWNFLFTICVDKNLPKWTIIYLCNIYTFTIRA